MLKKSILIFVAVLSLSAFAQTGRQYDNVALGQICVETETDIWFTCPVTGNNRHVIRLAAVGASRFDKIYAMLLLAKANNRTIHFHDTESGDRFTGWLIVDQ